MPLDKLMVLPRGRPSAANAPEKGLSRRDSANCVVLKIVVETAVIDRAARLCHRFLHVNNDVHLFKNLQKSIRYVL